MDVAIRRDLVSAYFSNLLREILAISKEKHTPWFLRPIRYSRRVRKAIFQGETPDWVSESYKLIKYVNLLEAVPTVGALISAPQHFFRRLSVIRFGLKKWYKTPPAFLVFMVVGAYACVEFLFPGAVKHLAEFLSACLPPHDHNSLETLAWIAKNERLTAYFILLVICFTVPLWIIPPAVLLGSVSWILDELKIHDSDDALPVQVIGTNPSLSFVPLDIGIYRQMHAAKFAWGLFYYGLYALFVLCFAALVISQGLPAWYRNAGVFLVATYYSIIVSCIQLLLIPPYAALLRESSSAPTRQMHTADAHGLISVIRQIQIRDLYRSRSRPLKSQLWRTAAAQELTEEWTAYVSEIRRQTRQEHGNPQLQGALEKDQKDILRSAITFKRLQESVERLEPYEKNPGSVRAVLRGLEAVYEGRGIPPITGKRGVNEASQAETPQ